jgi:hypothetical protein
MHEEKACNKTEPLAISHIRIKKGIGLEYVKEGELTRSKGTTEVRMCRKCPSCRKVKYRKPIRNLVIFHYI